MARHEPRDGAPTPADGTAVPGGMPGGMPGGKPGETPGETPGEAFGAGETPAERLARARAALAAAQAGERSAGEGAPGEGAPGGFGEAAQAGYAGEGSAGRAARPLRTRASPNRLFRTASEAAEPAATEPSPLRRRRRPPAPLGAGEGAGEGEGAGAGATALDVALGGGLARGTIHEILAGEAGDLGAAHGFALACAARLGASAPAAVPGSAGARLGPRPPGRVLLVQDEEAAREDGAPYGPGLALAGLDPAHLVLVRARDAREALWATEQALRCRALGAVLAEIARLPGLYDLTASRRLVLAAREGGTTGLVVQAAFGAGEGPRASAAETRFVVCAAPSRPGLAGTPGAPAWRVRLARHRGGREGLYHLEWSHDDRVFRDLPRDLTRDTPGEALPRPRPADARDGPRPAGPARPGGGRVLRFAGASRSRG
ncbi:ImuA family protein [Salinarimonas chemoclinalis]|uniref:ImuA family protein n=1 Tax=Salinarimonas chemoclinalis TaxID=3241599 RepID=UPI003558B8DA